MGRADAAMVVTLEEQVVDGRPQAALRLDRGQALEADLGVHLEVADHRLALETLDRRDHLGHVVEEQELGQMLLRREAVGPCHPPAFLGEQEGLLHQARVVRVGAPLADHERAAGRCLGIQVDDGEAGEVVAEVGHGTGFSGIILASGPLASLFLRPRGRPAVDVWGEG